MSQPEKQVQEGLPAVEVSETVAPEAQWLQQELNRVLKPVFASYVASLEEAYKSGDYEVKAELYGDIVRHGHDENGIWLALGGTNIFVSWTGVFRCQWTFVTSNEWLYYTAETSGIVPDALEELREVCRIAPYDEGQWD